MTDTPDLMAKLDDAIESAKALRAECDEWQRTATALAMFAGWVEGFVSQPVGAFSVDALNGIFAMTRDKLAALEAENYLTVRPISNDDSDDLNEALSDAVCDGEGRATLDHVKHHLSKRGYKIIKVTA